MKLIFCFVFSLITTLSSVNISNEQILPTTKENVEKIFSNNKIEVEIINQGGFSGGLMESSKLTIKQKKINKVYKVKFYDRLDGKKYNLKISHQDFEELKKVFLNLVEIHEPNKELMGDCMLIDNNYILKSNDLKMIIEPNLYKKELFTIGKWISQLKK